MSAGQIAIFYDTQASQISGIVKADTDQQYIHHQPRAGERRIMIASSVYATLHSHDEILDYLGLAKPIPVPPPLIFEPSIEQA